MDSRNNNGCKVVIPYLDESPVKCEKYYETDCIYVSETVDLSSLGMEQHECLSALLNKMICCLENQTEVINKQNLIIEKLREKINKLT